MPRFRCAVLVLFLVFGPAGCGDSGTDPNTEPEPPLLTVSTTGVDLDSRVGGQATSTTVAITNGGDGDLTGLAASVSFEAGQPDGWLTATLDASDAPATLTLEAVPPPLSGTYEATVTLIAAGAEGSPQMIEVSLAVAAKAFLYLVRQSDDMLRRMDPETLELVDVGPLGVDMRYGDCTWNPDDRMLYVTDGRPDNRLYRVDLTDGATTVGTHGFEDVFALEYHLPSQTLFGTSDMPGRPLIRFDLETGEAEVLGDVGRRTSGLVWDPSREVMLGQGAGVAPGSGTLFTIDVASGARTDLGFSPPINNHGLTYDPERDLIWGADVDGRIYQFDPASSHDRETVAEGTGEHVCIAYVP